MSHLKAPNGKPSNLTPQQWKLVRTPQFKAWFGDWENDPENASKVVDENGEPLVVYHGTPYQFTIFKKDRPTIGAYGQGFYFTNDKGFASNYAKIEGSKILNCFLNVKHIFEIDNDELPIGYEKYSDMADNKGKSRDFTAKLKSLFYDGVFAKNTYNENEFIVFEPTQIKLADGSNTTFDGNNPDIRFAEGGEVKSNSFMKWYIDWYKSISDKMFIAISLPTIIAPFKEKNVVILDVFEKKDQSINSKPYLKKIVEKADEYGVVIYLKPKDNIEQYQKFGFELTPNKQFMKRIAHFSESADFRFAEGGMTYREYVDTQFNENEDRYLPSGYLDEFQVQQADRNEYPILFKKKNGLEYRIKNNDSSVVVFDNENQVAYADNKAIMVAPTYQKRGIGLELVRILKERNPSHRFGSMTPEGFNLMGKYYDTYIANNPDIRFAEGGSLPNSLHIVIENVNPEKKYFGQYKKIFDVIEEDITLYNPYGTEDEKIIGNDFHIWISPIPDNDKVEQIKKLKGVKVLSNYYAEGGKTRRYMKKIKRGGITYGKSHAEGGIPVKNQSTGDMLEVEGGEGIVNKRSMASDKRVKLNGKDMTICEAVSQLNQMEGGVKFSCDDVEDRQFIEAMAKGGELERGTRTEQEHIQVLKDLYAKRITPKEASKRIAKDHLKEDSRYYSKLAKMEGKMADGGKIQSLSEFGNEFEKAKKELYSSNDAYQKSVEEGVAIKNDSLLSDQEKEKLLEIARKTARANKEILESARKGLTDLRTDSSPFYAPKLEWGGNLPKSVSKAIENLQVGDYKFKISHALLPQKGVDVFLKIHVPRQVVEGELKFQIGNRNLNHFNQRAVVNDVLNKYLKIDPSLWAINFIGRISKSTIVDLVLAKELIPESQNIALQISKALCNEYFYKNDVLATNPTPTPPTEKKDHIDTEVEITRWSEQKVREKNDNPAMTFKVSNLVGYILLNLGNARMSDFTQLIAYAKESEMLSKEIAKLEQQGLDMNGFVIKLMADKVLNSIENLKAQIMLFTNKEEDIKEQLNTIVFFIPYLAELDTFDKDYIIHIK